MSDINTALLRKELEWATAQARAEVPEWDQSGWAVRIPATATTPCRTTYCIAGQTVVDTGHELAWTSVANGEMALFTAAGEFVQDVAARELGLTDEQGALLFHSFNSLADLWRFAADFADGEITAPVDVLAAQ